LTYATLGEMTTKSFS